MYTTPSPHDIVTMDRLARLLPVSRRWLEQESRAGRIPHLRAGRRRLYHVAAVRAALAERAATADGGAA